MFCTNCGKRVSEEDRFCRFCGSAIKHVEKIREENTEVMPDHEVTFEEEKPEIREENIEVMPDREVTFQEDSEPESVPAEESGSESVPTEDMILSQTMKLLGENKRTL